MLQTNKVVNIAVL